MLHPRHNVPASATLCRNRKDRFFKRIQHKTNKKLLPDPFSFSSRSPLRASHRAVSFSSTVFSLCISSSSLNFHIFSFSSVISTRIPPISHLAVSRAKSSHLFKNSETLVKIFRMGGKLSKKSEASAPRVDPSPSDNDTNLHYNADSQLQIIDTTLLQRMSRAVSSLSAGEVVRSVSFESLKEITACFLEMNQEVVKIILECKKDIWKTPELFDLVEEYLENSLQTLDFCAALERCLMRARDSQLIINAAIQRLEEEVNYEKALEDLRLFMADGDPFKEEFFREFQAVYRQQRSMLEKLMLRRRKLDKKLKSVRAWRRVSCVIFAATFASVLICSVVAAAVAAPPVAAALAAASSVPLGSMGRWFDSLLKHYEEEFMGEKEVMSSMQVGTFVAIKDLESIRVMVDQLVIQISSLLHCVDFTSEEENAVRFGVEEIRRKLGVFMKSIEDLGEQADRCSRDIRMARTVVLQRIIRYPKG